MIRTLAAWLLALSAAAAAPAAQALSPADLYARLAPSVWKVQTYDEDGLPLALGSAVVVRPEALVTNCHVLARAHRVAVRHDKQTVAAQLVLWDPARDVCELKAPGLAAPVVALADSAVLRVGAPVYAIGNPRGLDLTISEGILSSVRRNDKEQIVLLQTSAPVSQGSSGGGLFDDQGRLVGLTTLVIGGQKPGEAQNLNFAVPVEWVQQLAERFARLQAPAGAASAAAGAALPAGEAAIAALIARPRQAVAPPALADDAQLPHANAPMREAYRSFLTRPSPRAFAIAENGASFATWRNVDQPTGDSIVDPAQRAMYECQRRSGLRCLVYAVDDRVVFTPAPR